jgi:hypothetical protein
MISPYSPVCNVRVVSMWDWLGARFSTRSRANHRNHLRSQVLPSRETNVPRHSPLFPPTDILFFFFFQCRVDASPGRVRHYIVRHAHRPMRPCDSGDKFRSSLNHYLQRSSDTRMSLILMDFQGAGTLFLFLGGATGFFRRVQRT